uniref:Lipoprotein n=1 Tax=Burkholderia sp. (strain CCGE1003) TaxID=640512 RepID=E1TKG7_BURSG
MRHACRLVSLSCAVLFALLFAVLVSACGGGGGSASATPNASTSSSAGPGVTNATPTPQALAANAVRVSVDSGVSNVPNMPFVSLTICAPGTTQCQTIDHVLVDTGSWGVRVFAAQLPASLVLPQQKDASGHLVAECMQFFNGFTWGAVKLADLQIAGEKAASLPIQVIDPNYASVPADCASVGVARNTPAMLQANGILGIGVFKHDCGANCVSQALPGTYYGCNGAACTSIALAEALQVANPIPYFATDNNGSLLSLPAVTGGAQSVSGQLVFGIGTQSNNALGSAQVIGVSPSSGTFTTVHDGTTYSRSILDSGSTGLFFRSNALPVCASPNNAYYCPASTTQLSAMIEGVNGTTSAVSFSVANASAVAQTYPNDSALPLLAGPAFVTSSIFDWGLPFFYGRTVYAAIEQQATPGGVGPYVAY